MQAGKFSPIPTIISTVTAMTSVGIVSRVLTRIFLSWDVNAVASRYSEALLTGFLVLFPPL